jgi:Uma2 family endonuclease
MAMKSELLTALLDSPLLPELLQEGQAVLAREQERREKFYRDITPEHKWEFIQGEVVMHSPSLHRHSMTLKRIANLLDAYVTARACGVVVGEKAMTVFPRNDYEPDLVFFGPTKVGGIHDDTLKYPVPDLIVEVLSPSTSKRDRGIKFQDYALHGVGEYWIVDPVGETVERYALQDAMYPPVEAQRDGMVSSQVVAGFEIPVRAIFDESEYLAAIRKSWGA